MPIHRSQGTTRTEKLLAALCERSFLKLWSYPNPVNQDRKEFCDLLAVFDNHVFIFFDRENGQLLDNGNDPEVSWARWKRKVLDPQIRTANGAERYLRKGGKVFLDSKLEQPFPIPIDTTTMIVHKIIAVHGAEDACLSASERNVSGSLAIWYASAEIPFPNQPFTVFIDKEQPVHVLDSCTLPIILGELDTFYDFLAYLTAKNETIQRFDFLAYCGEEDLLCNYFHNFDDEQDRHFIGTKEAGVNGLFVAEGGWRDFLASDAYKRKKESDRVSYFWDALIQKTCQNALAGTLRGDPNVFGRSSAIREMAKEPRFIRRALSEAMIFSIEHFPESDESMTRNVTYHSSFFPDKAYVFLQLRLRETRDYENYYRPRRQKLLVIACGAAKIIHPELNTIVGIAMDAPKFSRTNSEDFVLMNCSKWNGEDVEYYRKENEPFRFFGTGACQ